MITKMKKIMLFSTDSSMELDSGLTKLGNLGLVHFTPFQPARDESIDRVDARIKQMEKALGILENYAAKNTESASIEPTDYRTRERGEILLMEDILNAERKRIELEEQQEEQKAALDWYEKWGVISQDDIQELQDKGIWIHPYVIDNKSLKELANREDIQILEQNDTSSRIVLITEDENLKLDIEESSIPAFSYEELQTVIPNTEAALKNETDTLQKLSSCKHVLRKALNERIRRYDVRNVQYSSMVIEEQVRCWKGFIPEERVNELVELAEKNSWGYMVEDPSPEEEGEVPTLIRNPRWAERIKPVMSFMGLVPGYKELDVSKIFMLFFTFFTGILVGDAGYGLLFLLLTVFFHRRKKFVRTIEFDLIYTLSFSIMLWGTLTGTFFGSETIAEWSFLSKLRVERLASFGGDGLFVQKVMFFVGAIHLSIGHLQLAWRYSNSLKALSQIGWVAIIWGLYLIVCQLVLAIPAPGLMIWLFIGGALFVALFSNPGQSFFKGILASLGDLPLNIISGFSDIISYIRLYAVGLSTVLMATSFNQMAIGDGLSTVASMVGAVIILILGHGLNIILAIMAVLVHGVRLNMLEYAGHANVDFSGNEYNPFKIENNNQ